MLRRNRLLQTNGATARMARYLQGRRALGRSLYASTPMPFLRRLAMVPDEERASDPMAGQQREWWYALNDDVRPVVEDAELLDASTPDDAGWRDQAAHGFESASARTLGAGATPAAPRADSKDAVAPRQIPGRPPALRVPAGRRGDDAGRHQSTSPRHSEPGRTVHAPIDAGAQAGSLHAAGARPPRPVLPSDVSPVEITQGRPSLPVAPQPLADAQVSTAAASLAQTSSGLTDGIERTSSDVGVVHAPSDPVQPGRASVESPTTGAARVDAAAVDHRDARSDAGTRSGHVRLEPSVEARSETAVERGEVTRRTTASMSLPDASHDSPPPPLNRAGVQPENRASDRPAFNAVPPSGPPTDRSAPIADRGDRTSDVRRRPTDANAEPAVAIDVSRLPESATPRTADLPVAMVSPADLPVRHPEDSSRAVLAGGERALGGAAPDDIGLPQWTETVVTDRIDTFVVDRPDTIGTGHREAAPAPVADSPDDVITTAGTVPHQLPSHHAPEVLAEPDRGVPPRRETRQESPIEEARTEPAPPPAARSLPPLPRRARIQELGGNRDRNRVEASPVQSPPPTPSRKAQPAAKEVTPALPSADDGTEEQETTPAEWYARLVAVARAEAEERAEARRPPSRDPRSMPVPGPSSPASRPKTEVAKRAVRPQPTKALPRDPRVTLSDDARRLLTTTTGVDPIDVPIYHGPRSRRISADLSADAVTVPGAVVLGSAFDGETPEGLGLLAHELTHVARQREPRFVPPAGRRSRWTLDGPADEEATALAVEGRAIAVARSQPSRRADPPVSQTSTRTQSAAPVSPIAEPARDGDFVVEQWGGLPAPWEPLPGLQPSPGPVTAAAPGAARSHASATAAPSVPGAPTIAAPAASASPAGVQRADIARAVTPDAAPAQDTAPPRQEPPAPPPDLDAMARQVYTILKRRLEAEIRRERV